MKFNIFEAGAWRVLFEKAKRSRPLHDKLSTLRCHAPLSLSPHKIPISLRAISSQSLFSESTHRCRLARLRTYWAPQLPVSEGLHDQATLGVQNEGACAWKWGLTLPQGLG